MGNSASIEGFVTSLSELKIKKIDINDHDYWQKLFTQRVFHMDLFDAISEQDITHLRIKRPDNLALLMFKCIEQIYLFSHESNKEGKKVRKTAAAQGDQTLSVTTALVFLTKILPYCLFRVDPAMYKPGALSEYAPDFAMHVLVNNLMCCKDPEAEQESHMVFPAIEDGVPLGDTMIRAVVACAFVPGFTVGPNQILHELPDETIATNYPGVHSEVLWKSGVASENLKQTQAASDVIYMNRSLVLRMLLSAFSSQAYTENGNQAARLRYFFNDPRECPLAATLVISMLNEVANYYPYGSMPYSSHFITQQENLIADCLSVLTVAFDTSIFQQEVGPAAAPSSSSSGGNQQQQRYIISPEAAISSHAAWNIVDNLTDHDATFLNNGLLTLLYNNSYSRLTYLPGSQRVLPFRDEIFIVMWKLLYKSKKFRRQFCRLTPNNSRRIVVPTVTLLVDGIEDNATRASMLQLAVMLLETLSMERDFALALNENFVDYVPFKLPAWQGTYFDLVVYAMHVTLACRNRAALSMHHAALSTVANMAPCATSYSLLTAMKLLGLLEQYAKPEWLDSDNPPDHMLVVLLYTLASAIQYQFHGASHVAYALLRRTKVIKGLWEYIRAHSVAAGRYAEAPEDAGGEHDDGFNSDDDDDDEQEEAAKKAGAAAAVAATSGDDDSTAPAAAARPPPRKVRARFSRAVLSHMLTLKCACEALEGTVLGKLEADPNFDIHTLLHDITLVGKIPVPHPLLLHRVPVSPDIDHWITSVAWSTIYQNGTRRRFLHPPAIRLFARPKVPLPPIDTDSDTADDSDSDDSSETSSSGGGGDEEMKNKQPTAVAAGGASAAAPAATATSPERGGGTVTVPVPSAAAEEDTK